MTEFAIPETLGTFECMCLHTTGLFQPRYIYQEIPSKGLRGGKVSIVKAAKNVKRPRFFFAILEFNDEVVKIVHFRKVTSNVDSPLLLEAIKCTIFNEGEKLHCVK